MESPAHCSQQCWNPRMHPGPLDRLDPGTYYSLQFGEEETNFKICHDNDSNIGKAIIHRQFKVMGSSVHF